MTLDDIDREISAVCAVHGWEYALKIEVASECAWSAELRITKEPNRQDGPDRSLVVFAAAGATAEDVVREAVGDMSKWIEEP